MELHHYLIKILLEAAHVGSIEIAGRQVDLMDFGVVTLLSVPNVSILKYFLGFCNTFEESVALRIQPIHILHSFQLILVYLVAVCYVVEFDEVFGEDKCIVENKPESLLLIILFGSEDTGDMVVHLGVNLCVAPYFRW